MQPNSIYTGAVVMMIGAALIAKLVLLRQPHRDHRLLRGGRNVWLYAMSKLALVLAVAFAVAADASRGTSPLNAASGCLALLLVTGLAGWSVEARLRGRFFGLAHHVRIR